ncbi:MAG: lactate utilization protein [Oscillospiraceae bacterium]|jgi:L-lactate utilization protein LutB
MEQMIEKTMKGLRSRGFEPRYFETAAEAADYLAAEYAGRSVAFGGSKTLEALGLYERLTENGATVAWHWKQDRDEALAAAQNAEVYICSANAIAETGEIVNIDGSGNRVASTLFGKKEVCFVVGKNKLTPDYNEAVWRARNVAAPLNARRLKRNTPCVKGNLRCYDCNSPERICRALVTLWNKMTGCERVEVLIIGEELGY